MADSDPTAAILAAHRRELKVLRDALARTTVLVVALSDKLAAMEMAHHDLDQRMQKLE